MPVELYPPPAFSFGTWDLGDAIDALSAFDAGATDSGVSDPALMSAVASYLQSLSDDECRATLARLARRYLTDEAIAAGYGIENICELSMWLSMHSLA